jgi:hypothetical protein
VDCKHTYDSDFKITIAEYITISGGHTNALIIGSLNRQLLGLPIAESCQKSTVCASLCHANPARAHFDHSKLVVETKEEMESLFFPG